jgi:hypothetical protein
MGRGTSNRAWRIRDETVAMWDGSQGKPLATCVEFVCPTKSINSTGISRHDMYCALEAERRQARRDCRR